MNQSVSDGGLATIAAKVDQLQHQARQYVRRSMADSTRRAYTTDWDHFEGWCEAHGLTAMPAAPETAALYITDMADNGYSGRGGFSQPYAVATISRHLASISRAHKAAGHLFTTQAEPLYSTLEGIKNARGVAQAQKAPLLIDDIRALVALLPDSLLGQRDRALILVGFAGALRRSELVALNVEHLSWVMEGVTLYLPKSKTDQRGEGAEVGIPFGANPETCPVRALQGWLQAAEIQAGAVFPGMNRHGRIISNRMGANKVAKMLKKYAKKAGLDPDRVAGHSLRAGFATTAALNDVPERQIQDQTRHKSVAMLRRYIRKGQLYKQNAARHVGL